MLMKTHPRAIRWDCSDLGAPAFARVQNREIVYASGRLFYYTLLKLGIWPPSWARVGKRRMCEKWHLVLQRIRVCTYVFCFLLPLIVSSSLNLISISIVMLLTHSSNGLPNLPPVSHPRPSVFAFRKSNPCSPASLRGSPHRHQIRLFSKCYTFSLPFEIFSVPPSLWG